MKGTLHWSKEENEEKGTAETKYYRLTADCNSYSSVSLRERELEKLKKSELEPWNKIRLEGMEI